MRNEFAYGLIAGAMMMMLALSMQSKQITHNVNLTLEKPIEARLKMEAVNCLTQICED